MPADNAGLVVVAAGGDDFAFVIANELELELAWAD